jgi:tRNA nucleotidyltransferase (CCA-adding enzyme)
VKIYLVGGAVRDRLLDLAYVESDWVVVGGSPEEMLDSGFRRADQEFPVFLHPETGEEYALARREVKTAAGYKGFQLEYGPDITLEEDLLRRDLTINALAMDETGELVDVCNGRRDLEEGVLRHITPAFSEDPVRLLRIARFAAKLGQWGFRVAHSTHALMKKMTIPSELQSLSAERVWREMSKALAEPQPWRFFEVLHRCGALSGLLPEVAAEMGMDSKGHGESTSLAFIERLKRATEQSNEVSIRCAVAFFHVAAKQRDPSAWMRRVRIDKQAVQLIGDLLQFMRSKDGVDRVETVLTQVLFLKPRQELARYQRFLTALRLLWPDEFEMLKTPFEQARMVVSEPLPQEVTDSGLSGHALGNAIRVWRVSRLQQLLKEID